MTRAKSRKSRGLETQALIAKRWRESGLYPYATDAGSGRSGVDILNTGDGLAVEVKAKEHVSLMAGIRQARIAGLIKDAEREGISDAQTAGHERATDTDFWYPNGPLPVLITRHNGQGPASIGEWTVTMTLAEFEEIVRQLQFEGHL